MIQEFKKQYWGNWDKLPHITNFKQIQVITKYIVVAYSLYCKLYNYLWQTMAINYSLLVTLRRTVSAYRYR